MMAECIKKAILAQKSVQKQTDIQIYRNAIEAMQKIAEIDARSIDVILLDIMLDGPDGFTLLNELVSYNDTSVIPIVIVTALKIKADLSDYGVIKVIDKSTMQPSDIREAVKFAIKIRQGNNYA